MLRHRLLLLWSWYSFGVRDNGVVGYLRHVRQFERLRRDVQSDIRRMLGESRAA